MLFKLTYTSPFRPDGGFIILRLIPDLPETERPACLSQRRGRRDGNNEVMVLCYRY
ncbi:hypothetical protein J8L13_15430 [Bacteroides fragilis]|uniref:hypothetical protein n=1 Tax=Bacteroides fragilis TaxID=817 RepID=UPI00202EB832|nr:hypothetical protein [Bacteroides fragilis]MCM0238781.1 hypothetical protein [Bacteroides fragilis]